MAVAVDQRLAGNGRQRQPKAPGLSLANQKLLEQQSVRTDFFRGGVGAQRKQFVAKSQKTARLQADDGYAAQRERRIGGDQPIEFGARTVNEARREKGPPAAQRPAVIQGPWDVDAVSALDQHAYRGIEIFALIGAVEGVGKQHDFATVGWADGVDVGSEYIAAPPRQRALRADAGEFFQQPAQQRTAITQVGEPRKARH